MQFSEIVKKKKFHFRTSVSAVAKISVLCPNIASWYSYAKTISTYSNILNSTSALTELGSVIGKFFLFKLFL